MGGFILFILILFFIIFLLGGVFLRGIMQLLFKRSTSSFTNYQKQKYNTEQGNRRSTDYSQSSQHSKYRSEHKKVFSKYDGEYVDFEEVK